MAQRYEEFRERNGYNNDRGGRGDRGGGRGGRVAQFLPKTKPLSRSMFKKEESMLFLSRRRQVTSALYKAHTIVFKIVLNGLKFSCVSNLLGNQTSISAL